MGDDAEKKYLASLDFKIDTGLKNLDTLFDKLQQISQESDKISKNLSKKLNGSIGNINIGNVSKGAQAQYAQIEKIQAKSVANQIKIEQQKNAQIEIANTRLNNKLVLEDKKMQNKLVEQTEKGATSRIASLAKTYLAYQGFNMLKKVASETVQEMINVESQMVSIERVMEDGSIQIENYRDKLITLAYDYGNSFENVADITLRLAQAGFDAQEALALTEKTLLALNTADLDAKQATSDMVAVMAQWGLMTGSAAEQAENYGNIIDKINKVADSYPTTSQDIMEALKKTSSAFNIAGASIDETIATIVAAETASQRGGKAIGTALSNITQQLKDVGKIDIAKSLGISFYTDETETEFKDIMDIFGELSEKMQQLKEDGKESSVEMQDLLSVFTVFRRNIGASLLGEMAGEDSTYAKVLKDSIESVGYSLNENEKYMKTAEAAQNQFNATLLELKTAVWDNGLEDVFRSMLLLGADVASAIKWLVDTFGAVPITIGAATLAFSTFSEKMKLAKFNSQEMRIEFTGAISKIKQASIQIKAYNKGLISAQEANSNLNKIGIKGTSIQLDGQKAKLSTVSKQLAINTVKTIGLEAATVALNAAMSLGLSVAITAIISLFDNLIHAEEKAMEKMQEDIDATQERIDTYTSEAETISELIEQYKELSKKENRTSEDNTKIYEIQVKINDLMKETGKTVDLVNGSYKEQLNVLKEMTTEQLKQLETEKKKQIEQKKEINYKGLSQKELIGDLSYGVESELSQAFKESDEQYLIGWHMSTTDLESQLEVFEHFKEILEKTGKTGSEAYEYVTNNLEKLNEKQKEVTDATNDYYDTLAQLKVQEWFINSDKIKTLEDYQSALDLINKMPFNGMDGFKEKLIDAVENYFPQFNDQAELASGNLSKLDTVINTHLTTLQKYAEKYAILRNAQDEYNQSGSLSISMMQSLIDNNLLQYLSIQNGQLQINAQSMLDLAEATKVAAIEALQDAASKDIEKAATNDVANMSSIARGALAEFQTGAYNAGQQAVTSAEQIAALAGSLEAAAKAGEGKLGEGIDIETYRRNVSAIISAYKGVAETVGNINIKTAAYTPQTTRGSSSGGSSTAAANAAKREAEEAANAAKREAEEAAEAAEKARKAVVENFEEMIEERERLENRWVKNKKALGLISDEDEKYILQQSIQRYKKYAEEVNQLTMATEEEKAELRKKYLEEAEDLEVEYFELLKDLLDEQIDAIEEKYDNEADAYEEMIDSKIEKIEQQADAEIEALEKVEDVNDRIRQKEEYEASRRELIHGHQGIEYWQQRTGREAQIALAEAQKELEELDKNWEETTEQWSVEDQITLIEQRRDADIEATEAEKEAYLKALEETKNAEIKALKDKYQYQIDYFNETGEIIVDNATIQAREMFEAYKTNFIDPVGTELKKALAAQETTKPATTTTPAKTSTTTYTIKYGDTLSAIARSYGTTIEKILAANPYVTNKNLIYAGKTLQIPTSHTGSKIIKDGLVELQAGETVLNMDWAKGLDKMLGQFNNQNNNNNTINNGSTINIDGSLVKVEANIEDKTDAVYLTKRITKELTQKFNLKK